MLNVVAKGCGCPEAGSTGEAECQHPSPSFNFPTVKCIRSTAEYFADRLYKAMKVSRSLLLLQRVPEEGSPCHGVHGDACPRR